MEINWEDPAVKAAVDERVAEANRQLEQHRNEVLAELKGLKDKFKTVDLDEYSRLRTEREDNERKAREAEQEAARKAGDFDKYRAQLEQDHTAAIKAKDGRIEALYSALTQKLVDAELSSAITAEGGIPEILLPLLKDRVRVVETDNRFGTEVADLAGAKQYRQDGTPAGLADLVREMKSNPVYGGCFKSPMAGGSGSKSVPASGVLDGVKNPFSKAAWNLTEQMRLTKTNPELAKQLKAQAE